MAHFASRSRQRGVTLLEALVAFFVLAAGSVAVAALQRDLHLAAETARERSQALRAGEDDVEQLRTFTAIDRDAGVRSYAAIASANTVVDAASAGARTAYRIERIVDDAAFEGTKATTIAVRWPNRRGGENAVVLHGFVAALDPQYSGSLALDVGAIRGTPRGVRGRSAAVPPAAKPLDDGRSAWKPVGDGTTAWLFDDRTAAIIGVCDGIAATTRTADLDSAALGSCAAGRWAFVSGSVRVATTAPAVAASLSPASLAVRIELQDGVYPAPATCVGEARKTVRFVDEGGLHISDIALDATAASLGVAAWQETGDRFLAWRCLVAPRSDGRWSGRIAIVANGWTIGGGAGDGRVCRFAPAEVRAAIDANIGAARLDADVDGALPGRHFVVVRGSDGCPATTAQQQP
jgi:Tfp pilus assembly protein PilV